MADLVYCIHDQLFVRKNMRKDNLPVQNKFVIISIILFGLILFAFFFLSYSMTHVFIYVILAVIIVAFLFSILILFLRGEYRRVKIILGTLMLFSTCFLAFAMLTRIASLSMVSLLVFIFLLAGVVLIRVSPYVD